IGRADSFKYEQPLPGDHGDFAVLLSDFGYLAWRSIKGKGGRFRVGTPDGDFLAVVIRVSTRERLRRGADEGIQRRGGKLPVDFSVPREPGVAAQREGRIGRLGPRRNHTGGEAIDDFGKHRG